MTEENTSPRPDLTKSTATIPSDSENYDSSNNEILPSPPSSERSPIILYKPPTFWSLLRGAAINLLLPFVNGLMLGFGELLAHEAAFNLGWSTDKISSARFPTWRSQTRSGGPVQWPLQNSSRHIFALQSIRFASTETSPYSSDVRPANPSVVSYPSTSEVPSADRSSPPDHFEYGNITDSFDDQFIAGTEKPVEMYSGYLKDLGLDYGWGPTAFMQTAFEQVYMFTGLPWWVSIILSVAAVRVSLFKLYINSSDAGARLAAIRDIIAPLDKSVKEATILGDQESVRAARFEKKIVLQKAGIKYSTLLMPTLIQIPLGFGTFRLIRGMTMLPVPGMDTGGGLWFPDLTVPDPFYVLPFLAGAALFKTFQLGGENGGAGGMKESTRTAVGIVLPAITFIFAAFWPAGLQISITCGGAIALSQAWLFRQLWFRDFFKMQRFPPKPAVASKPTDYKGTLNMGEQPQTGKKTWLSSFKDAYNDVVKQGQDLAGKKDGATRPGKSQAELKKAKTYEEKKTREAAQRRFEWQQARRAAEEDRRLR